MYLHGLLIVMNVTRWGREVLLKEEIYPCAKLRSLQKMA